MGTSHPPGWQAAKGQIGLSARGKPRSPLEHGFSNVKHSTMALNPPSGLSQAQLWRFWLRRAGRSLGVCRVTPLPVIQMHTQAGWGTTVYSELPDRECLSRIVWRCLEGPSKPAELPRLLVEVNVHCIHYASEFAVEVSRPISWTGFPCATPACCWVPARCKGWVDWLVSVPSEKPRSQSAPQGRRLSQVVIPHCWE